MEKTGIWRLAPWETTDRIDVLIIAAASCHGGTLDPSAAYES